MTFELTDHLAKAPAVTLGFWIIKIFATTLGETVGDTVSMTWNLGFLIGTAIFGIALIVLVIANIRVPRFHPFLYWSTVIASTSAGTTMADFADRSLGIGYPGGSLLLLTCVFASLFAWYRTLGTVSVTTVSTPKTEAFYWLTVTSSQALGLALGDWVADFGPGYSGGALIFSAALAVIVLLYFFSSINHVAIFWAGFILTRPLGATVGDFFVKPIANGGLAFSRPLASALIAAVIVILIRALPQRASVYEATAE